jgi:hypothetical protein
MRIVVVSLIFLFSLQALAAKKAAVTDMVAAEIESGELRDINTESDQSETKNYKLRFVMFFLSKLILDGVALNESVEQREKTYDISSLLHNSTQPCEGVCQTHTDSFVKHLKSTKILVNVATGVIAANILFDIYAGVNSLTKGGKKFDDFEGLLIGAIFFSGLSFISLLGVNGNLWDLALWYQAGIQEEVISALFVAMNEGIYPLISSGIVGLPGAVLFCLALAQSS